MPRYATFGVWDKDIKQFITELSEEKEMQATKSLITEWFYSDAMNILQQVQAKAQSAFIASVKAASGQMPILEIEHMRDQKKLGLEAVKAAFSEKFLSGLSSGARLKIEDKFTLFIEEMAEKHKASYDLQTEVTNLLYAKMNAEKDKYDASQTFDFVCQRYKEAKTKHPKLAEEIDSHIQLLTDFKKYTAQKAVVKEGETPLRRLSAFTTTTQAYMSMGQSTEVKSESPTKKM